MALIERAQRGSITAVGAFPVPRDPVFGRVLYNPAVTALLLALLMIPTTVQSPADRIVHLESLDLSHIHQQWGSPKSGRSVEGNPLRIASQSYTHGLGTHAYGEMSIDLFGNAKRFTADVGVDDDTNGKGAIRFEVYADEERIFSTGVMSGHTKAIHLDLPMTGVRHVLLASLPAADGISFDHADWANADFVVNGAGPLPKLIEPPVDKTMPIYQGTDLKPEINGALRVGCSPGLPFLFKIAASGEGPLRYSAFRLPKGLRLDPATGVITGRVSDAGDYPVRIRVHGPKGVAGRTLDIVCGHHLLALTPPMGWNSWNVWAVSVTADRVKAAANAMVNDGLADFGYRYVNIDDAWEGSRNAAGEIRPNDKFGDMKALADYVHSKGLGLGIYSSPGARTCAGYPGSLDHEAQDAITYANWGIDYLKYDWCSYGDVAPNPTLVDLQAPYAKMRTALDGCGRDIVFSFCQYGMGDVYKWGKQIGGNLWRTTGDINDTYDSMASIAFRHSEKSPYAGPGGWNDPDMLVVGRLGWGPNPRPTRLSPNEQITHITMWSLLAAPLILGCDLTQLDPWTKALITNHDVIEVDQDPLGRPAVRVSADGDREVWARHLADGTVAVGLINRGRFTETVSVTCRELGLSGLEPVRDLWRREDLGQRRDLQFSVPGHGARLFRVGRIIEN
jgi:alpha-galactosidase